MTELDLLVKAAAMFFIAAGAYLIVRAMHGMVDLIRKMRGEEDDR